MEREPLLLFQAKKDLMQGNVYKGVGWAGGAKVKRGLLPPNHKLLPLQAWNPEPRPVPQPLALLFLNCASALNRNLEAPTHPGAHPTSPIWLKPEVACLKFPNPRTTSVRDTAEGDKTGSAFLLPSSGLQCLSLVKFAHTCWHRVWEMHFSVPSLARYAR